MVSAAPHQHVLTPGRRSGCRDGPLRCAGQTEDRDLFLAAAMAAWEENFGRRRGRVDDGPTRRHDTGRRRRYGHRGGVNPRAEMLHSRSERDRSRRSRLKESVVFLRSNPAATRGAIDPRRSKSTRVLGRAPYHGVREASMQNLPVDDRDSSLRRSRRPHRHGDRRAGAHGRAGGDGPSPTSKRVSSGRGATRGRPASTLSHQQQHRRADDRRCRCGGLQRSSTAATAACVLERVRPRTTPSSPRWRARRRDGDCGGWDCGTPRASHAARHDCRRATPRRDDRHLC